MRGLILAVMLAGAAGLAPAQSVGVHGMLGPKALIVIDGGTPKAVAPGETYQGIKVLSTRGDRATVQIDGRTTNCASAPHRSASAAPARPMRSASC